MRSLYLDFEFSRVTEPKVNLVSCSTLEVDKDIDHKWWLYNDPDEQKELKEYLQKFDRVIAYSAVAECRSFIALGLDPLKFEWIDLFLEYRMITNHNDRLNWGKQLVDGKVRFFKKPKPKWERTEEDKETGFKPTHSLAEATYKLTGQIRDTKHKDKMRDLIISDAKKYTEEEKHKILEYNMDDVLFLPTILKRIKEEVKIADKNLKMSEYINQAMDRGRYSAHTALMENNGYPIDVEKTRNFSRQVGNIIFDAQRHINSLFPDIKPFKWHPKKASYTWDQKITRSWVEENHDVRKWMKTETGKPSLSLDAFERYYPFKHNYPEDNFGAQIVRFLKLKQSLYGFSASGGTRKNFWDSVGSDGRARPYMNHYGAQSSRSQPGASGFMFLKPAWMRALVVPEKGKFMASIDYGQQEFFIAALESQDNNMIEAYLSGDPYLFGAKLAGAIPKDGTKETHAEERNLYKNTYLGIQYGMTKFGLAIKLTQDTGRKWTEDEAQEQIDIFENTFPDYMKWKLSIGEIYARDGVITLPCGWKMFGDNDNIRSVYNVPVQGFGASVLRKSVDLAVEKGCKMSFTLHDANYIEGDIGDEIKIKHLADAMTEAFVYYVNPKLKNIARQIKLDPFAWSPNYKKDSEFKVKGLSVPCSNLYIDSRSQEDYDRFSKYFNRPDLDLI